MFKKIFILALTVVLLTGCGVNIRQEGNKVYTDITKDQAYAFSSAALKTKGYKVTEESKINYYLVAQPEFNETFKIENASKTEIRADISDNPEKNETVVAIQALVNGNVDEEKSKKIAEDAVKEIIAELDLYGKFTASKEDSHVYPVATLDLVKAYVASYYTNNNLSVTTANPENNTVTIKEATANNPFNEPLQANVGISSDETKKVTVTVKAEVQGNYDIKGNQQYTESFVTKFLTYLDDYPLVEKGLRFTYKYISFEKAFANTKKALKESGFLISESNDKDFLISAAKNGISLSVTFTNINNNIAVNLEALKEGKIGDTKDALTTAVTAELNKVQEALAKYQTILTTDKLFISTSLENVFKYAQVALKRLGYSYTTNKQEMTISAVNTQDANKGHFLIINNLGAEGISIEINTMYNNKSAKANEIVKAENDKLLKILGEFDKQDLK